MVAPGRDGVDGVSALPGLLAELLQLADDLRAVGLDTDDDGFLLEVAGDLHALVARHAVEALRGRAA